MIHKFRKDHFILKKKHTHSEMLLKSQCVENISPVPLKIFQKHSLETLYQNFLKFLTECDFKL